MLLHHGHLLQLAGGQLRRGRPRRYVSNVYQSMNVCRSRQMLIHPCPNTDPRFPPPNGPNVINNPQQNPDGCVCRGDNPEYPNPNPRCESSDIASQGCWGVLECNGVGTCKNTGYCNSGSKGAMLGGLCIQNGAAGTFKYCGYNVFTPPTKAPTNRPTTRPTRRPTPFPTKQPTRAPVLAGNTAEPTAVPPPTPVSPLAGGGAPPTDAPSLHYISTHVHICPHPHNTGADGGAHDCAHPGADACAHVPRGAFQRGPHLRPHRL